MQLHWQINSTASALHAAAAAASGRPLANERVADALQAPLFQVSAVLAGTNVSAADLLRAATPLSPQNTTTADLVRAALSRLGHADMDRAAVNVLSAAIDELNTATLRASPDLVDQLALRIVPLRDAWDARGPGFWKSLRRITGGDATPGDASTAKVLCVQPVLGGGGDAFPADATVTIEAVLANPHFQLPEVVRLGWLLAQLYFFANVADQRERGLRLVTAVLTAAQEVELARCEPPTIRLALDAWHLSGDTLEADAMAETLWRQ